MGFVPVQSVTTYFKSDEADLQIDFFTSMHRGDDTMVLIKALNDIMRPLKFKYSSMAESIQMPLLELTSPILVNAPPHENTQCTNCWRMVNGRKTRGSKRAKTSSRPQR
jgi:hypothetical protein